MCKRISRALLAHRIVAVLMADVVDLLDPTIVITFDIAQHSIQKYARNFLSPHRHPSALKFHFRAIAFPSYPSTALV
jgi:hypothetical protein